jgi:dihydrofolate synthase/folylpolyglutamate synthase
MTYNETIDYLYQLAPMFQQVGSSAYKEGMDNSFRIDRHLRHPHTNYRTIHVAGTNGKGSTAHLLASILQEAGYRTGLYTSPHLLDFRERIRVNGQPVDEAFVIDFTAHHRTFFESIRPSFFELTTGMAFAYFAAQSVEVAVVEVGLGGRLDCTNILHPALSIITNISLDHTHLLGHTPTAIAREKAGIMKPAVPVIVGEAEGEVKAVFVDAKEHTGAASLRFASDNSPLRSTRLLPSGRWMFETDRYPHLTGQLGGYAQEKNAATVLCAVEALKNDGWSIPDRAVYRGFARVIENTGLLGRWQIVQRQPKIVLDTGHNVGGMSYIVRQLQAERCTRLHVIFGMVNDKDISTVLALLADLPARTQYYFTQASVARALAADQLAAQAAAFGLHGAVFPTVAQAFRTAQQQASEKDLIFAGGSTFLVADVLKELETTINR